MARGAGPAATYVAETATDAAKRARLLRGAAPTLRVEITAAVPGLRVAVRFVDADDAAVAGGDAVRFQLSAAAPSDDGGAHRRPPAAVLPPPGPQDRPHQGESPLRPPRAQGRRHLHCRHLRRRANFRHLRIHPPLPSAPADAEWRGPRRSERSARAVGSRRVGSRLVGLAKERAAGTRSWAHPRRLSNCRALLLQGVIKLAF